MLLSLREKNIMKRIYELNTKRLKLRQWKDEDYLPFSIMSEDKEVMKYFYSYTLTSLESNEIADKCRFLISIQGWGFWAVEEKETGNFIGFVGLNQPGYDLPFGSCIEIGWRLDKKYWGKGYAFEAAKKVLDFAFRELNLKEIYAFTSILNKKSYTLMERIGMKNTKNNFLHPLVPVKHSLSEHVLYKIINQEYKKESTLNLENIAITGRTFEEYSAFFDLKLQDLKGKKVLDCPSGASSFVHTLKQNGIFTKGVDVIYEFSKNEIEKQGIKTLEKIYQNTSWMDAYKMDFYKTKENHKKHREDALKDFLEDYNSDDYIYCELPNLPFENKEFDLLLSSHLFFVYDDRLDYDFHKNSILEMLRVSKEVRLFPLVDIQNSKVLEEKNFSPFVYKIIEELSKDFKKIF